MWRLKGQPASEARELAHKTRSHWWRVRAWLTALALLPAPVWRALREGEASQLTSNARDTLTRSKARARIGIWPATGQSGTYRLARLRKIRKLRNGADHNAALPFSVSRKTAAEWPDGLRRRSPVASIIAIARNSE